VEEERAAPAEVLPVGAVADVAAVEVPAEHVGAARRDEAEPAVARARDAGHDVAGRQEAGERVVALHRGREGVRLLFLVLDLAARRVVRQRAARRLVARLLRDARKGERAPEPRDARLGLAVEEAVAEVVRARLLLLLLLLVRLVVVLVRAVLLF